MATACPGQGLVLTGHRSHLQPLPCCGEGLTHGPRGMTRCAELSALLSFCSDAEDRLFATHISQLKPAVGFS